MRAIGMKKKWVGALDVDLAHKNISTTLSVPHIAGKKMNNDTWNYLVMACEEELFDIITSEMETNTYTA
jgi:hypothetical protein